MAALDMYAERGQWEKCIETASKQVLTCRLLLPILQSSRIIVMITVAVPL